MTLTFNLAIWFLFATHGLIMIIICAKLFSNPTMHNKVMGRTPTSFTEVYAQNLSVDCDLDLWPNDMVLVRDTSSCHDDHLCQIIFKSHNAWQTYGSDTNRFHWIYAQSYVRTVTLTFDLATWFLFVTHCLVMMIISAKLFSNPIMYS